MGGPVVQGFEGHPAQPLAVLGEPAGDVSGRIRGAGLDWFDRQREREGSNAWVGVAGTGPAEHAGLVEVGTGVGESGGDARILRPLGQGMGDPACFPGEFGGALGQVVVGGPCAERVRVRGHRLAIGASVALDHVPYGRHSVSSVGEFVALCAEPGPVRRRE